MLLVAAAQALLAKGDHHLVLRVLRVLFAVDGDVRVVLLAAVLVDALRDGRDMQLHVMRVQCEIQTLAQDAGEQRIAIALVIGRQLCELVRVEAASVGQQQLVDVLEGNQLRELVRLVGLGVDLAREVEVGGVAPELGREAHTSLLRLSQFIFMKYPS